MRETLIKGSVQDGFLLVDDMLLVNEPGQQVVKY